MNIFRVYISVVVLLSLSVLAQAVNLRARVKKQNGDILELSNAEFRYVCVSIDNQEADYDAPIYITESLKFPAIFLKKAKPAGYRLPDPDKIHEPKPEETVRLPLRDMRSIKFHLAADRTVETLEVTMLNRKTRVISVSEFALPPNIKTNFAYTLRYKVYVTGTYYKDGQEVVFETPLFPFPRCEIAEMSFDF